MHWCGLDPDSISSETDKRAPKKRNFLYSFSRTRDFSLCLGNGHPSLHDAYMKKCNVFDQNEYAFVCVKNLGYDQDFDPSLD
jgi:hypothetical protein